MALIKTPSPRRNSSHAFRASSEQHASCIHRPGPWPAFLYIHLREKHASLHESFACFYSTASGPTLSSSTFHSLTDVLACNMARSSFSSTSQNFGILGDHVVLLQDVVLDIRPAVLLDAVTLVAVTRSSTFIYLRVVRRLYVYGIRDGFF